MAGAFLNDQDLKDAAASGAALVNPFDADAIQSASIDLRIGNQRYEYTFTEYSLGDEVPEDQITHSTFDEFWLAPGCSAYVGLAEEIKIPADTLGLVFPRSTMTRLGIAIYPVYMNPGYAGNMPVTITNHGHVRVRIVPGARVAQLLCAKLSGPVLVDYGSQPLAKYHNEQVSAAKADNEDFAAALQKVMAARMPWLAGL